MHNETKSAGSAAVPLFMPLVPLTFIVVMHLVLIFLAFWKYRAVDKDDRKNTISCGIELEAGALVENISDKTQS